MTKFLKFCLLITIVPTIGFAEETFAVFVPDRPNQQLLTLTIKGDGHNISINQETPLPLSFGPSSITKHPNGTQLIMTGSEGGQNYAATVEVEKDASLRLVNTSPINYPTGYTSVDRSGRFFMTVHYGTGQIATYNLETNGTVSHLADSLRTPKREAHCILTTPDNRFVYIPCVKLNNALYQYAFDDTTGRLTPLEPFNAKPPAMYGPRHVAYHPDLPVLYFSNEQQLGVSAYSIGKDGQLTDLQHIPTIPRRSPFEQGKRDLHASDIAITPNGKLLFVALRDFNGDEDSIFSFSVNTEGKLSPIDRIKVGDIPWKIDTSPDGNYLITRQTGDPTISLFSIKSNGIIQYLETVDLPTGTNDFSVIASK